MVIRKTEVDKFLSILTLGNVGLLMEKDKCCNYVDNYLLATVLVYFKRAGLNIGEYTEDNFWRCLYLAHDQVVDVIQILIFSASNLHTFLSGGG